MNKNFPVEIWDMILVERRKAFKSRVEEFGSKIALVNYWKNDMIRIFERNSCWDIHFSTMYTERYLMLFVKGDSRRYVRSARSAR